MSRLSALAVGLTALLAVVVTILALLPPGTAVGPVRSDKLLHMLAFLALALPVAAVQPRWILPLALMLALHGALIEIVQPYFGRGRELADWLADLAGIGVGAGLGLMLNRLGRRWWRQAGGRAATIRAPATHKRDC